MAKTAKTLAESRVETKPEVVETKSEIIDPMIGTVLSITDTTEIGVRVISVRIKGDLELNAKYRLEKV